MPLIGVSMNMIHPDHSWPVWALVIYCAMMGGFCLMVLWWTAFDFIVAIKFRKLQKKLESELK